jgi:two-component system, OmpR family, alkaline phosphatase synthesis response regulator PhoP
LNAKKSKILIADDDPMIVRLLKFKLSQQGFTVIVAQDGEEAIKKAKAEQPDLIISEVVLPGLDGFEILRRMKDTDQLKSIPIIMLTVKVKDTDVVTGLELGVTDYMTKPFSLNELIVRINRALQA